MGKREIGTGLLSVVALAAAFLLPVTFTNLTGLQLGVAWGALAVGFLVGLWLLFRKPVVATAEPEWKSLRDFYDTDFGLLKLGMEITLTVAEQEVKAHFQVHRDFNAHTDFVSAYIPREGGQTAIGGLAMNVHSLYQDCAGGVRVEAFMPGETQKTSSSDLKFTGTVFVYHETHLEPRQVADLIDLYKSQGLTLRLRGPSYATARNVGGG